MKIVHADLKQRVTTQDVRSYGILGFGVDNLYPQTVDLIVESSGRAVSCTNKLAEFIEGHGFEDEVLGETVINVDGQTMDKLLRQIAEDTALFKGRAYLLKYNPLGTINEIYQIPYEWCRIGIDKFEGQIAVYDNWDRLKVKQIKKNDITFYPTFNPEVALEQINEVGFEAFTGQVLYMSGITENVYGLATVDAELESCVSDSQIKISHYSSLITGFMDTTLITLSKRLEPKESEDLGETLSEFQGAENAGKMLILDGLPDGEFAVTNLTSEKVADAYLTVETSVRERIRQLYNTPRILLGDDTKGGLADQGNLLNEAKNYYSEITNKERRAVSNDIKRIFEFAAFSSSGNFDISPIQGETTVVENG